MGAARGWGRNPEEATVSQTPARRAGRLPQRNRRARATPETAARFQELLSHHLAGGQEVPDDLVGYLDYLASLRQFAFHGSGVRGLRELSTERRSGDARAFGRQESVYASPDPHWAAFFAVVNRAHASSINNFSIGLGANSRTRWYRRDVVLKDPTQPVVRPGWLYVLPRSGFRAERRALLGLVDTAHWVSAVPVEPLFSLQVRPEDYPLARHVRTVHRGDH